MCKIQIYERKGIYTINEVLSKQIDPRGKYKRKENRVDFDGDSIKMDSHRYWTFKYKGIVCKKCKLEGKYFAKERIPYQKKLHLKIGQVDDGINKNSYHFNLYGIDEYGQEVLFTKDHIYPKSKGGDDHIDNYDTMCCKCNIAKGDKIL